MNQYNPDIHHRRSIRLKEYDYSLEGIYFVTLCVQNRECLFGEIINDGMELNDAGKIVNNFCITTETRFMNITFDPFVIMPNHFHVIITVGAGFPRPMPCPISMQAGSPRPISMRPVLFPIQGRGDPAPTIATATTTATATIATETAATATTLGKIVGFFKYQTTKHINIMRQTPGQRVWQRNYYEHIIRDENDYNRIYEYIHNNPLKWELDKLHPRNEK